jgi:hypothetical protein
MDGRSCSGRVEHIGNIRCFQIGCTDTPLVWWTYNHRSNGATLLGFCKKHKNRTPDKRDFIEGIDVTRVPDEIASLYNIMAS